MAKIAILLADLFEDSEYSEPVDAFLNHGYEVVRIGLSENQIVKGKKRGVEVLIQKEVSDLTFDDFDALLIPGGYSPDTLRADTDAVEFVRQFAEEGKPVFAICHGPQLLVSADVLRGRTLTGYKSIIQDIKNAGGLYLDQDVVVDENLVTSRTPADLPAFVAEALKMLANL